MSLPKESPRITISRNVWVTSLTSFLADVSSEMVFNLLPLYLLNVLGVGTAAIGLIEGLAESSASLLKIASGWLSDRMQARKSLAVFGYGLSAIMKPLLALARTWPLVLAIRWGERLGKGIRTAPRDALLAASVEDDQRGFAFGIHRAADTAGAAVGILIAWWVVRSQGAGGQSLSGVGFRTVAILSAIPALLAVLVLALAAHEVGSKTGSEEEISFAWVDFPQRFRWYLLAVGIFTLGNSADAFLVLRAQNLGLAVERVLLVVLLFNIVYALVSGPAGKLSDRWGRLPILLGGWVFYAAVYLGFAVAEQRWQVVVLMSAYGLYYGLTEGVARALVADLVTTVRRGTAYGAYHTIVGVLALPASLFAGLLWQGAVGWGGFGPWAPFAFGAATALLAAVVLVVSQGQSMTWRLGGNKVK